MRELLESGRGHIPTQVMLDYVYGIFDDELLDALFGGHLGSCPRCSKGVEVYRRQRPVEPARLTDVPEFSHWRPVDHTYQLTPEEAGKRLQTFISEGTGPLLIVAGEANPAVYSPELADVLRERADIATRAGDPLPQVICGPAIGLDEKIQSPDQAVLPTLAEEGVISLCIAQHRQRLHFRVSGEDSVYTEEYHEAGNPGDRHGYWYKSRPIAGLFKRRFQALLTSGLAQQARRTGFVYLTMDRIRQIQSLEGERFDRMTAEELAAYPR